MELFKCKGPSHLKKNYDDKWPNHERIQEYAHEGKIMYPVFFYALFRCIESINRKLVTAKTCLCENNNKNSYILREQKLNSYILTWLRFQDGNRRCKFSVCSKLVQKLFYWVKEAQALSKHPLYASVLPRHAVVKSSVSYDRTKQSKIHFSCNMNWKILFTLMKSIMQCLFLGVVCVCVS